MWKAKQRRCGHNESQLRNSGETQSSAMARLSTNKLEYSCLANKLDGFCASAGFSYVKNNFLISLSYDVD